MDPDLSDTIRYDELRLVECEARPALHRHQIAAYEAHLAIARGARDAIDLTRRLVGAGRTCEGVAATWCDRQRNLAAVLRAIGAPELAGGFDAAAAQLAAVRDDEFLAVLIPASIELEARRTDAAMAGATLAELACAAIDWATAGDDAGRAEAVDVLAQLWHRAREHDPRFTWARVAAHAPYRHRLPFDDAGVARLGAWIAAALGVDVDAEAPAAPAAASDLPAPAPLPAAELRVPTAAEVAAPYQLQLTAIAPDPALAPLRAAHQRIQALAAGCTRGPELQVALAGSGLFTALARHLHDGPAVFAAARAEERGHLHAAQHHRALAAELGQAASPTEVEHAAVAAEVCFAIEASWHDVLLHAVTRPVHAAATLEGDDTAATRAAVVASVDVLGELLGLTPAQALTAPRIDALLERFYLPLGQQITQPPGAMLARYGDSGLAALPALRAAAARAIAERVIAASPPEALERDLASAFAQPRFASADQLRDHLLGLIAPVATAPAPAREMAKLVLWHVPVALGELHAVDVPSLRPRPAW